MTPVSKNTAHHRFDPGLPCLIRAASLFAKGGFDGVSVDDIARDAGVNKAMIYYHFADKLALYRAVRRRRPPAAWAQPSMRIAAANDAPADQARSLHRRLRAHDGDAALDAGADAARNRRRRAAPRRRRRWRTCAS